MSTSNNFVFFDDRNKFNHEIKNVIKQTEVILDIGPGIYPFNAFVPKLHILIEPWSEYTEILKSRFAGDHEALIIKNDGLSFTKTLGDNSVDSSILIDVIEHMEKDVGFKLIQELERVTREQLIIFTPLGFMPQHVSEDRSDRWGLSGGELQQHLSGWTPEDFGPGWDFYVCNKFHEFDDDGNPLDKSFGAFYAIKNISTQVLQTKEIYHRTFFRKTSKDLKLEELTAEILDLNSQLDVWKSAGANPDIQLDTAVLEIQKLHEELYLMASELSRLNTSISFRVTKPLRYLKSVIKFLFKK